MAKYKSSSSHHLIISLLLLLSTLTRAQNGEDDDIFGNKLAPLIIPGDGKVDSAGGKDVKIQVVDEYTLVFEEANENKIGISTASQKKVDAVIDQVLTKLGQPGNALEEAEAPGCKAQGNTAPKECDSKIKIGNFKAIIVKVSNEDVLTSLRKIKGLKFVEKAAKVKASQVSCTNQAISDSGIWGLDHIDVEGEGSTNRNNRYHHDSNGGAGVRIYILDSGIRTTHNNFNGRAIVGSRFCTGCQSTTDGNGHGTHVAGIAGSTTYGVAKASTLVAVKVLDDDGTGFTTDIIRGINWAANDAQSRTPGKGVANLSLGGPRSTSLDNAVSSAVSSGMPFVVAAGNEDSNACSVSPARAPLAITVGSITSSQARSSFSNFGTCLDVFAPGSSIRSTWADSNSATAVLSGTSMSSPHVAGAVAIFLGQNDCASPSDVDTWVRTNSVSGVTNRGSGSPDRMAQVNCDNADSSITCSGGGGPGACSSSPCLNGGTCTVSGDTFTCSCRPGFTGTTCATNINECSSNPCLNGGSCRDGSNRFTCSCLPGWSGLRCQTESINDVCSSSPCLNGGTCVDTGPNTYSCLCTEDFTGFRCENNVISQPNEIPLWCVWRICSLQPRRCRRCYYRGGLVACRDVVATRCNRRPEVCNYFCGFD